MNVECVNAEELLTPHSSMPTKMRPVIWLSHGAHSSICYGVMENSFFSWAYGLLVITYAPESAGKRSESFS